MTEHAEIVIALMGAAAILGSVVGGGVHIGPIVFPKLSLARAKQLRWVGVALLIIGLITHLLH